MKTASQTGIAALLSVLLLFGCSGKSSWYGTNITGVMPPLAFSMTRASDGAAVTARDYRGKLTLLFFGYTQCPDECPTTLANVAAALAKLGPRADRVRMLFVTVDPDRDSLAMLKEYAKAFAPQVEGLRGTKNQLASLARRYRVAYSVSKGPPYDVMHSDALFFFDGKGDARLVTLETDNTEALANDMERLLP